MPDLIITPPTADGNPTPTVTLELTRDGADVLGEVSNGRITDAAPGAYSATWRAVNSAGTDSVTRTATVEAPASITFEDPAESRIYQRSTTTGGDDSKGAGTVPLSITASDATPVYARLRDADSGAVIKDAWLAGNASAGTATMDIPDVPARLGWMNIDLAPSASGPWTQGARKFGMGRLIAVSGQSLAVRMIHYIQNATTSASVGVSVPENSAAFTYPLLDNSTSVNRNPWGPLTDGGQGQNNATGYSLYNSAFAAQLMEWEIEEHGVNCGAIGSFRGGTEIRFFTPGQTGGNALVENLQAAGGCEAFIWCQGHTDARNGISATLYRDRLVSIINAVRDNKGAFTGTPKAVIMPPSSWAGSLTSDATIAQANAVIEGARLAAAAVSDAQVVMVGDMELADASHQTQAGNIKLARSAERALRGDFAPPVISSVTRADQTLTINVSLTAPDTALIAEADAADRIRVYAQDGSGRVAVSSISVSGSTITAQINEPAGKALNVYFAQYPALSGNSGGTVRGNAAAGLGLGLPVDQNTQPVQVAAVPVNPGNPVQKGPNLTPTGMTYEAASSGFGQRRSGGFAESPDGTGIMPASNTWTLECRFKTSGDGAIRVLAGQGSRGWLGVNTQGRLVGNVSDSGISNVWLGGSSNSAAGTNPIVSDNVEHHAQLVAAGNVAYLFLDGVLVASQSTSINSDASATPFYVGRNLTSTSSISGSIDEVAVWNVARNTASFTAPTAPYSGTETALLALYHLDGNANAAIA